MFLQSHDGNFRSFFLKGDFSGCPGRGRSAFCSQSQDLAGAGGGWWTGLVPGEPLGAGPVQDACLCRVGVPASWVTSRTGLAGLPRVGCHMSLPRMCPLPLLSSSLVPWEGWRHHGRCLEPGTQLLQGEDSAAARGRDGPRDHHEGHPQGEGPLQGAPGLRCHRRRHLQAHSGIGTR